MGSACQQGAQQIVQSAGPGMMAFVAQTRSACGPYLPRIKVSSRFVPPTLMVVLP